MSELTGTIKKIGELQTYASGFQKRELILLTEETYPQPISIEFLQDKSDLLDPYKEGESVKVSINIRGKMWTSPQGEDKYFNSIVGWRLEKTEGSNTAEPTKNANDYKATPSEAFEDLEDSLPF